MDTVKQVTEVGLEEDLRLATAHIRGRRVQTLFEKLDKHPESDDDTLTVEPTMKPKCLLVSRLQQTRDHPVPRQQPSSWHHENDIFHNRVARKMVKQPTPGIRPYHHDARHK